MKKLIASCFVMCTMCFCFGFSGKKSISRTYAVIEDTDFGSVYFEISIDGFNADGFKYGDSLDVTYSTGHKIEDVPYYTGYYVRRGSPVVVGYQGYKYIEMAYGSEDTMWKSMELKPGDSVTVTLRQRGKYLETQKNFFVKYSDKRSDYKSDEIFANFRSLSGGKIKSGFFYRGASPVDDEHNRAETVDRLIREKGVKFDLNLSDTEKKVESFKELYPESEKSLFVELAKQGNVALLGLSSSYGKESYACTLADGLRKMMAHEGPYYIHCVEGKDRTGFVCLLLEALSGASYEELENDYMITYQNYFGITKKKKPAKYAAFRDMILGDMFRFLAGKENEGALESVDYGKAARNYLKYGGMSDSEIDALIKLLTE